MKAELVALNGICDLRLLAISALLAFVMSYAGFEVVERARAGRGRTRRNWILAGGAAVGVGLSAASIGVAALPDQGISEKELLEAADAAHYRAKREGRDRVIVAEMVASERGEPRAVANPTV